MSAETSPDQPAHISREPTAWEYFSDRCLRGFTAASCVGLILLILVILGTITYRAYPAYQQDGTAILTGRTWDPHQNEYGILPQIWGTVYTSVLAVAIATIFGVSAAIFLSEHFVSDSLSGLLVRFGLQNTFFKPWPDRIEHTLKTIIELLAAIPSVVYGLWGIFVVIPYLRKFLEEYDLHLSGPSVLPASLVLAIMLLPTVTAISRDALLLVPVRIREAAYGIGATRWQALRTVILPMAAPGIVGGILLAFGRALGETMALAMLVGNRNKLSLDLLEPANTLAALMANTFKDANGPREISVLMYAAVVLFVITMIVNALGNLVLLRANRMSGRKSS